LLDAYCKYSAAISSCDVLISRHNGSDGHPAQAAGVTDLWNILITNEQDFAYPAHIEGVWAAGSKIFNLDVIPRGVSMDIVFANQGKDIREDSIEVYLNGQKLTQDMTSGNYYYAYQVSTGKITINSIGDKSGTVLVKAKDKVGNALEDFTLHFVVTQSTSVSIKNLLVYPTPYRSGIGQPMRIGFDLTAPARVTFCLINMVGDIVWKDSYYYANYGYKLVNFDGVLKNGRTIPSGVYVLYAIAESDLGVKAQSKTKVAVW
jgi:hypothetical protein